MRIVPHPLLAFQNRCSIYFQTLFILVLSRNLSTKRLNPLLPDAAHATAVQDDFTQA